MTTPTRPTELERFDQGWITALEAYPPMRLVFGLVGLTRVGERLAALDRLAAIVNRPVPETVALLREHTAARIDGGLVHWDVPFPVDRARRTLHVGDRTIPMNRCALALFVYAVLLDVPFRVAATCPATGAPIRIDFVPGGYERVDPPQTVTAMISPDAMCGMGSMTFDQADEICLHAPLFASAEAAGWLAGQPPGRARVHRHRDVPTSHRCALPRQPAAVDRPRVPLTQTRITLTAYVVILTVVLGLTT